MSKRVELRKENKFIRRVAFELAGQYGIDTPESRQKQAEFTRQLREAVREGVCR